MLLIARSMGDLSFGSLMEVYEQSNQESGRRFYPEEPEPRRQALAEQHTYDYLRNVFFQTKDARYAVLIEDGKYVSALRLEPYQDGLLMEALETAPRVRRRGYATALLRQVQQRLTKEGAGPLYSHVDNKNTASLAVHARCGFQEFLDYAVFLDGSADRNSRTLCWKGSLFTGKTKNGT